MNKVKQIFSAFANVAFPVTCVCCGSSTAESKKFLCNWCRHDRFESAGTEKSEILPEIVLGLYSLWHFDKGGYLQQLLHDLKYNHLQGVGEELGYILGESFLKQSSDELKSRLNSSNPLLVPVPLHKSKRRSRGYNQARAIARGISMATGWQLIRRQGLLRLKRTKTQTGLNSVQRSDNLKGAFRISNPDEYNNRIPVIVDDVFTTGATTFELSGTIHKISQENVLIMTVARA